MSNFKQKVIGFSIAIIGIFIGMFTLYQNNIFNIVFAVQTGIDGDEIIPGNLEMNGSFLSNYVVLTDITAFAKLKINSPPLSDSFNGCTTVLLNSEPDPLTLETPTNTKQGRTFTVMNSNTSVFDATVEGIIVPPGKYHSFLWDGSKWITEAKSVVEGGWTDDGVTVRLTTSTDTVGVGTESPNATLDVTGTPGSSVGGFASGQFHVTSPSADVNANSVITGHSSFGGNKQLWYLGSTSSSNDNIAFINRQNADLDFYTNNTERIKIRDNGDLKLAAYPNTRDDGTPINILGTDAVGNLISGPNEVIHIGGNFIDTTDQSIAEASTPQTVTFSTNSLIDDVSHTTGTAIFTINTNGVYNIIVAPQLAQGSGSATVEFWLRKNSVDIANSNVQETISANSESLPILRWKGSFSATDTLEIVWASNSVNSMLDNITSSYGGPNIPSIMLGITQVGS